MARHISVVINTYNAGTYLRQVLEHVKRFDEIVVCDMESTDATLSIAREYGCKIVTFPKGEHKICEPARNFAIQSASNEWVLVVDADEIIPQTLTDYLYEAIEKPDFEALAIARINLFMGTEFPEKGDYTIRLLQKAKTYWPPVIHTAPQIDGRIKKAPHRRDLSIIHLDDPDISQWLNKINKYTDYELPKRGYRKFGYFKLFIRPMFAFFKSYVMQRGFVHGKVGIINAYMSAFYQSIMMAKVIEYQKRGK